LPWKYLVRRILRRYGFVDPFALLTRLEGFAQPSEVNVPVELLRAGVAFHARGLLNTRVIQHNLDWVWPYWVREQFDPHSESFVPRAFSATHINLTHRNWTGVGVPGCWAMPVVDPRGLVTPFRDQWSVDAWFFADGGAEILPAYAASVDQRLDPNDGITLRTIAERDGKRLSLSVSAEEAGGAPWCVLEAVVRTDEPGWLAFAVRPFNPEGVSLIETIEVRADGAAVAINDRPCIRFERAPDRFLASTYEGGDVHRGIRERAPAAGIECPVGMASAAGLFRVEAGGAAPVRMRIDLSDEKQEPIAGGGAGRLTSWADALAGAAKLEAPEARFQELYDAALRTLVLLSPEEVYPGPYTYRRFWFRDAAFLVDALCAAGLPGRARRALARYPERQGVTGYFHSQEGEWDANGAALWAYGRYAAMADEPLPEAWRGVVHAGAGWIGRKRIRREDGVVHGGLLPAGFSAEHLGNNDYYYWDDFWSVAGLQAAGRLARRWGEEQAADGYEREAADLLACIDASVAHAPQFGEIGAFPASPYRRMDAGAVGSICGSYPLRVLPAGDARVLATARWLQANCFVHGAFFQDMIHSGLNAYLTLHVAQVLLRAGEAGYVEPIRAVARLASPTGQWPEAIHPRTGGGCMGDGQHGWAAAEWILMMRNLFVREEDDALVLASGIPAEWVEGGEVSRFGPGATAWGPVTVEARRAGEELVVAWQAAWFGAAPRLRIAPPGWIAQERDGAPSGEVRLKRQEA
jgi:hypothetical protein